MARMDRFRMSPGLAWCSDRLGLHFLQKSQPAPAPGFRLDVFLELVQRAVRCLRDLISLILTVCQPRPKSTEVVYRWAPWRGGGEKSESASRKLLDNSLLTTWKRGLA